MLIFAKVRLGVTPGHQRDRDDHHRARHARRRYRGAWSATAAGWRRAERGYMRSACVAAARGSCVTVGAAGMRCRASFTRATTSTRPRSARSSCAPGSASVTRARSRRRGDYFLFEMAGESVIVVRAPDGGINALLNVCRHRGSRICDQPSGHESRLMCRYHGWTYGLDGSLRAAAHMPEGFDRSTLGLRRLHVRVFWPVSFSSISPTQPPPFTAIERRPGRAAAPVRARARQGRPSANYPLTANWKLADRELLRVLSLRAGAPRVLGRPRPRDPGRGHVAALLEAVMQRAPEVGLTQHVVRRSWLAAGVLGTDRGFDRYPLLRGHLTGSRDGAPVAPLLGSITGYDGAHDRPAPRADDLRPRLLRPRGALPVYAARAAADRLRDHLARQRVSAVEGKDYDRRDADLALGRHDDRRQDRSSSATRRASTRGSTCPGPLSSMEDFTQRFLLWYVAAMREPPGVAERSESRMNSLSAARSLLTRPRQVSITRTTTRGRHMVNANA